MAASTSPNSIPTLRAPPSQNMQPGPRRFPFAYPEWRVGDRVRTVHQPLEVHQSLSQTANLASGRNVGWPEPQTRFLGLVGWVSGLDGQTTRVTYYTEEGAIDTTLEVPLIEGEGWRGASRDWCFHPAALEPVVEYSFNAGDRVVLLSPAPSPYGEIGQRPASILAEEAEILAERQFWRVALEGGGGGGALADVEDRILIPVYHRRRLRELAEAGGLDSAVLPPFHRRMGLGLERPQPAHIIAFVNAARDGETDFVADFVRAHPEFCSELAAGAGPTAGMSALCAAAAYGQEHIVTLLLIAGAAAARVDFNRPSRSGKNPYHYAVEGGHASVVRTLWKFARERGDIDARNVEGRTPLHCAIKAGNVDCVEAILDVPQADPNAKDASDDTPLHSAISLGGESGQAALEALLSARTIVPLAPETPNKGSFNALHWAVVNNRVDGAAALLRAYPQLLNSRKSDNCTPLHLATFNGCLAMAEFLAAQSDCLVQAVTIKFQSVLHTLVQPLLIQDSGPPTATACPRRDRLAIAGRLLERERREFGLPAWLTDTKANTPLHLAMKALRRACERRGGPPPAEILGALESASCFTLPWLSDLVGDEWVELGLVVWFIFCGCPLDEGGVNDAGHTPLKLSPAGIPNELWHRLHRFGRLQFAAPIHDSEAPPPLDDAASTGSAARRCASNRCVEGTEAEVAFLPCGHRVFCRVCAPFACLRSCPTCATPIQAHRQPDGLVLDAQPIQAALASGNNDTEEADKKAAASATDSAGEDEKICGICYDRKLEMSFQCGHLTCEQCGELCRTCPVCRLPVTSRIKLYLPWMNSG